MTEEEKIRQDLLKKFSFLENKLTIRRQRRISAEVALEKFPEVFDYTVKTLGFTMLSAISGLDEGENLSFIYHLAGESGIMFNLKTCAAKTDPAVKTVTDYFPGAEIYEREIVDLLGARVDGLRKGKRYPLPDNWPQGQYPLRKGWKKEILDKQQESGKNA